ncbi:MAG: hypothetical protein OEW71_01525 [Candidatus Bathyarchaeota archaeon]|nr:hypothetical protein [Candidatus Bathyarchaeota archaeon]
MENRIKFEIGWKQKAKENFSLRTQRLFGIVRNVYCKIKHSGSATHFPAYRTAEMLKDYEIKAEQKKAEAIEILRRRLTIQ